MANVLDFFGVNGLNPTKVGGTGVAIKYFPRLLGSSIGAVPTTPSATNPAGMLVVPAGAVYNGQQLNVVATGNFGNDTGDPSGTVNIQLQAVTGSLASPVYTTLASTGALTPSALGIINNWALDVVLYADDQSGILGGSFSAYQNGALVNSTPKSNSSTVSGISMNAGNPNLGQGAAYGLVVGVTFGTSDASNKASMFQFQVQA